MMSEIKVEEVVDHVKKANGIVERLEGLMWQLEPGTFRSEMWDKLTDVKWQLLYIERDLVDPKHEVCWGLNGPGPGPQGERADK